MTIRKAILGIVSLLSHQLFGQIQTGVFRTPTGNTQYHQFTRTGGGAAVYINQTDSVNAILRLSRGTANANVGVVFTVENNGNVGIGTTNPKQKLSVNGSIQAREVKVTTTTTDWPDYVFKAEYSLLSLETLEQQIRQKGHLPGLPSAEEVATTGWRLGQTTTQLLKKVEELTLYILQQHKEMKAMQAEIQQLKQQSADNEESQHQ